MSLVAKATEIVIPVFNDPSICDTLTHLVNQHESQSVLVTIVDNSSSPDIRHMVTQFTTQLRLRYVRYETHVTFEESFIRAARVATGDYITFCGAGDLIDLQHLLATIALLPQGFTNGLIGGRFALMRAGRYRVQNLMPYISESASVSPLEFVSWCLNGPLSGLGGWIITRQALLQHLPSLSSPQNTRFPQVLLGLSVGTSCEVVQSPRCWYFQTSELDPNRQKNTIYRNVEWIERFTTQAVSLRPNDSDLIHRTIGQSIGRNLLSFHTFGGRRVLFKASRIGGSFQGGMFFFLYATLAVVIGLIPRPICLFLVSVARARRTGSLNVRDVFQLVTPLRKKQVLSMK